MMQVYKEKTDFLLCQLRKMHTEQGHKQYFFPTVEIKGYNVMIDGKKHF